MDTTWDGLPIAPDWPHGASIVVRRPDGTVLLLHRAHHGVDYDGPWGWTTPSGSRQPGEAILAVALRELAEEAGLTGIDVAPVDLTGSWALLTAEVATDAHVSLTDVEHDRFEWVPLADASLRVEPRFVADGIRRASAVALDPIVFVPLRRADLPDLVKWQNADHVRTWWGDAVADVETADTEYGPTIDGLSPGAVDVIMVAGRAVGFVQSEPLAADDQYLETARWATGGGGDAVAIDYAIGERSLTGRGIGTRMIWNYIRDVVLHRFPTTRFVVADPAAGNTASVRALEKAGFRRAYDFEPERGGSRHALCVFDRRRVTGDL
jgi:8-oxo-dGTP pyrophosphatase MutT (NUDIX family)